MASSISSYFDCRPTPPGPTGRCGLAPPSPTDPEPSLWELSFPWSLPSPPYKLFNGHSVYQRRNERDGKHPEELLAYKGHSVFCSRFSRISRLKLQGTLRLKSMNREQRERHEQGETDFTNFRSFRVFHGKNTGDTPFY